MNSFLRRFVRPFGKPVLEIALPLLERFTGFRTARGDYLPCRLQMLTGRYEAEELALMRSFLRPGQTILDVGANVGYTTRFFGRAVGKGGVVHAFEPNPLIFPLLKQNTASLQQVRVHNFGLSSESGELPLFLAGNNHSVASFSEEYPSIHLAHRGESMAKVVAKTERGDEILKREGSKRVDLIKVDVEGWEIEVLSGLQEAIAASPGIAIFCEFNPAAQRCAGHNPAELLRWFFDRNFALAYAENHQLHTVSAGQAVAFTERAAAQNYLTIFATRPEMPGGLPNRPGPMS